MTGPYIVCPHCGAVSHHPMDITERYCGACHQYHDDGEIDRQLAIEQAIDAMYQDWRPAQDARDFEWYLDEAARYDLKGDQREEIAAMRDEWRRAQQRVMNRKVNGPE